MEYFFLLDFGDKYGLGHLSRCSNLAIRLKKLKYKIHLITSKDNFNKINEVQKYMLAPFQENIFKLNNLVSNNINEINQLKNKIGKICKNKVLIIDHYFLNRYFLKNIDQSINIFQFKDSIQDNDYVDINLDNQKLIYLLPSGILPEKLSRNKNIFSGLDLFPLFPPQLKFIYPKEFNQKFFNFLFLPGASCDLNVQKIIEFIQKFKIKKPKRIYSPNEFLNFSNEISYFDGSKGISSFIYHSDIVISAAGNSMLESIFLNKITFGLITNNNQRDLFNYLLKKEKIFNFDEYRDIQDINFEEFVRNIPIKEKDSNINYLDCSRIIDILTI